MQLRSNRRCTVPLILAGSLFLFLMICGPAASEESSCILCHTDEDRLIDNLSKVEKKKSSLQAGSG